MDVVTPMSHILHTEVHTIFYWCEYIYILYLRYLKASYAKKIASGPIVCTIYSKYLLFVHEREACE
jgi:hypothetical protein